LGDNAERAMIELVDFNEIYGKGVEVATTTAKRTRRSGGKKKLDEVESIETIAPEAETTTTEDQAPE
jgi:large subunit ribosomal protein L17